MGLDTTQAHDHPTSGRPSTGNVVLRLANDADAINEATDLIPVSYMHQNLLLGAIDTIVNRMLPADRN